MANRLDTVNRRVKRDGYDKLTSSMHQVVGVSGRVTIVQPAFQFPAPASQVRASILGLDYDEKCLKTIATLRRLFASQKKLV